MSAIDRQREKGLVMLDNRQVINVIVEYQSNVPEPMSGWPRRDFAKSSYTRSAADAIINHITKHSAWPALRSVEDFKYHVGKYMLISRSSNFGEDEASEIFRVYYDTACEITDILYAMIP